jgi:hypothetical protein
MIDKNYLKSISRFNISKDKNSVKKIIEFNVNDDLNNLINPLYRYYTFSKEILQTIINTPPWESKLFRYAVEIEKFVNTHGITQRVIIDGEWREEGFKAVTGEWRRQYFNTDAIWGQWIDIEETISFILRDEHTRERLIENWDRYMIINKHNSLIKKWGDHKTTIDEIIEQIRTGTARI